MAASFFFLANIKLSPLKYDWHQERPMLMIAGRSTPILCLDGSSTFVNSIEESIGQNILYFYFVKILNKFIYYFNPKALLRGARGVLCVVFKDASFFRSSLIFLEPKIKKYNIWSISIRFKIALMYFRGLILMIGCFYNYKC